MTQGVLPPVHHGGDPVRLLASFPDAPRPLVDLSTGINPWSYDVGPLAETSWRGLPGDAALSALLDAAGLAYGAPPGRLVAAPGTQALIQILPRLRPRCRVAVLAPTYAEHARRWLAEGHEIREVAGIDEAASPGADVVVLCNPNNPDGRIVPPDRVLDIARDIGRRGGWLVVDEAFADCDPATSVLPLVTGEGPKDGLVVLRSFGKFYGLAGLRLGFALAPAAVRAAIADHLGPWSVSGPAAEIGARALGDVGWRDATRRRLRAAMEGLVSLLAGAGLEVVGGTSLFVLVRHRRAAALAEALGKAGIATRDFPERRCDLRFGLPPDEAAWARLSAVLSGWRDAC